MLLVTRNPFNFPDEHLHSLSSGFISDSNKDGINCDKAEDLGAAIPKSFDGESIATAVVCKKDCLKPLEALKSTIKIDKNMEYVNTKVLFTRLTALAQREDNVQAYLKYEIVVFPPLLFKDGLMRKPDKPSLRKALLPNTGSIEKENISK